MGSIINRAVLVINRNFLPCYVTNLKHAFNLLFREVAFVVDENFKLWSVWDWIALEPEEGEEFIGTPKGKIKVPKIIYVETDVGPKLIKPKISRFGVFLRDGFTCQYCGKKVSPKKLTIDHVLPKSKGGKTTWTNVVTACIDCNLKKGDKTPEEVGMKLIRQPKPPRVTIMLSRKLDLKFYPEWEQFILSK